MSYIYSISVADAKKEDRKLINNNLEKAACQVQVQLNHLSLCLSLILLAIYYRQLLSVSNQ